MTQMGVLVIVVILMLASAAFGLLLVWLADRRDARKTLADQTTAARIEAAYARTTELIADAWRRQETFILELNNRWLSRTFEELQYGKMIGGEIAAEQESDLDHEEQIVQRASAQWVKERTQALEEEMATASAASREDEV